MVYVEVCTKNKRKERMIKMKKQSMKERMYIDDEEIYRGVIEEMMNYSYVENYIGRFLVKIFNILEDE